MATVTTLRLPLYIKYAGKEHHIGDLLVPIEVTLTDLDPETGEIEVRGTGLHGIPLEKAVTESIRKLYPTIDKPKEPGQ